MAIGKGGRRKQKNRSRYHRAAKRHGRIDGPVSEVKLLHISPSGAECDAEIVDGACASCGWRKPA